ncbi:hypothetical protein [Halorubrum sp. DTA98]|uniref:hypothetical protein n=1 Tax=Halorubrum sp. DTA98 TaxID=3402163 RepID=UPI003AAD2BA8
MNQIEREWRLWFWYYVYSAAMRDHVLSMERSRERAVNEMNFTVLSEPDNEHVDFTVFTDEELLDDFVGGFFD